MLKQTLRCAGHLEHAGAVRIPHSDWPGSMRRREPGGRAWTGLTGQRIAVSGWRMDLQAEDTLSSRHVSPWYYTCRRINIELYDADSHFCHFAYVTWSRVEHRSAHVPARLLNFCCRTHFVRRDVRVERSSDVTICFQKRRKCWLKKIANGPFYMTPSHQIIEISM
jgi:hypothetical protein